MTQELNRWFDGSKVADNFGNPLPVYHGTGIKPGDVPFHVFSNDILTTRFDMYLPAGERRRGFYFTPRRQEALHYAEGAALPDGKPRVIEVYLRLLNPYIAEPHEFGFYANTDDVEKLKAAGYDSIIKMETFGDGTSQVFQYIAFDPEQIKSVDCKTFDLSSPSFLDQPTVEVPEVVYHGTYETFDAFDVSARGSFGSGIYFADRESAISYAEDGMLVSAAVTINRPYVFEANYEAGEEIDFDSAAIPLIRTLFPQDANSRLEASRHGDGRFGKEVREKVESLGYDGMIAVYPDGSKEYIAFKPEQVKIFSVENLDELGTEETKNQQIRRPMR